MKSMKQPKTGLIVEDEYITADALEMLLSSLGVEVLGIAHDAEGAERMAVALKPDIIFMDVKLGAGPDGVDAALAIREYIDSRIVYVTGSVESATINRIHTDHPFRILIKPYSVTELREAVAAA